METKPLLKIIQVDTNNRRQVRQFLDLPFRLYVNSPQWVPPLTMDANRMLNRKRHPFYQHSDAAFWLAINDQNKAVGRLAVLDNHNYNQFNHERTAFFYLFECELDLAASQALFSAAFDWARSRGLERIIGPKGFTALDGIGMLVKGFEYRPAFGLPYNPHYYPALVEASGFVNGGELVSGYIDRQVQFPELFVQISELLQKRRNLYVARYRTRKDLHHLVPMLKEVYNGALVGTTGNVPLTDEEVKILTDQLLWFADPRLIKIVMKREEDGDHPVGFLFAYPDISAGLQRTHGRLFPFGWLQLLLELRRTEWININGAGMMDGYRGLGGTALLFSEMYNSLKDNRYNYADIVQIGTDNDKMLRELRDLGIDFYKTHRLYQRTLV
jgi:hypothetical protein